MENFPNQWRIVEISRKSVGEMSGEELALWLAHRNGGLVLPALAAVGGGDGPNVARPGGVEPLEPGNVPLPIAGENGANNGGGADQNEG